MNNYHCLVWDIMLLYVWLLEPPAMRGHGKNNRVSPHHCPLKLGDLAAPDIRVFASNFY